MLDVLHASVQQLRKALAQGVISPLELVEQHIARIEHINPILHALVADDFVRARAQARQQTAMLAQCSYDSLPPLFGIPCTIKEFYGVAGLPNSGGLLSRGAVVAEQDAQAVQHLRQAGAIVLGVSNVPEGGMWMETYNRLYGRTHNPWDPKRTAGGSSGGEAALVASGAIPFGLASDLGGSIRIPAAFCGVIGHKPTAHLVPNQGCWPQLQGQLNSYLCTGPIVRRCEDLWLLLQILAGPEVAAHHPAFRHSPSQRKCPTLVLVPKSRFLQHFAPAQVQALQQTRQALEHMGAICREIDIPPLYRLAQMWSVMMAEAHDQGYAYVLGDGEPLPLLPELFRLLVGKSSFTPISIWLGLCEHVVRHLPKGWRSYWQQQFASFDQLIHEQMTQDTILLLPAYPREAPYHRQPVLTPMDFSAAGIINVLGMPATQIPILWNSLGLPVGVQLIGLRHQDSLTIATAGRLEQIFGGWRCAQPPTSQPFKTPKPRSQRKRPQPPTTEITPSSSPSL